MHLLYAREAKFMFCVIVTPLVVATCSQFPISPFIKDIPEVSCSLGTIAFWELMDIYLLALPGVRRMEDIYRDRQFTFHLKWRQHPYVLPADTQNVYRMKMSLYLSCGAYVLAAFAKLPLEAYGFYTSWVEYALLLIPGFLAFVAISSVYAKIAEFAAALSTRRMLYKFAIFKGFAFMIWAEDRALELAFPGQADKKTAIVLLGMLIFAAAQFRAYTAATHRND